MAREILLNAFAMNCVGHQSQGMWRHPRDKSADYKYTDHWVELARLLERGKFDGLFLADVVGVYDVYGGSPDTALREAVQVPTNDPLLIIPPMAQATENLAFAVTVNLSHEAPLPFARRMSTLDHMTNGRIGWNVVTGYLDSGAKGAGQGKQVAHDIRYDIAEEFVTIQYDFWEGSWEDDAVRKDREAGVFTDPAKVHRVSHDGEYFRVNAVHLCEPSPQRTPVLYQAGTSSKGTAFAARHAECVFVVGHNKSKLAATVANLRALAVEAGRAASDIKIFSLITVITAATDEEAQAKAEDYRQYVSASGALALLAGWTGIDFSKPELVGASAAGSNSIQTAAAAFTKGGASEHQNLDSVANSVALGGGGPVLVGSAKTIADELESWATECDLDGFNLAYALMPETFADIVDHLVPELQHRGLFKKDYAKGTYREKLFKRGPRLENNHPAARLRKGVAVKADA
ncbi:5,10-methylene tetrahydromethanopterin reductase [Phenylobacterium sp. Root77]|uniref:LLM class flavin-dependent oxidoreductase n=1 Tax=unclassified Phenylobacterium TaxID=2640670 RepID=UPI0006FB4796|nr:MULTISPECIES: LLM class flavin-dependent oxidoreductase [unclassified Phenylobacterium]KQW65537.1 5,10-methylene tetrahydromethanopterin reductase [Phenylobacterium sp. Root1277]KQW94222.1 5,10-methylene tetrahydromethanopterin reductase [Phenylobacterium sp. Root1290]KRC38976.1 5,10-methylene tetrahydromethanopterin reductase [Phenylobacterium sp. Root77]